jgi:hypothetical protein
MGIHRLTVTQLKNIKPQAREKKYADGGGLYLLVKPSGSMLWRAKYRFAGKEKTLSIGPYPTVGLTEARQTNASAKKQLLNGIDPSFEKKRQQQLLGKAYKEESFEILYREWIAVRKAGLAPATIKKNKCLIEKNVLPYLGRRPVADISRAEFVKCLDRVVARGAVSTESTSLF